MASSGRAQKTRQFRGSRASSSISSAGLGEAATKVVRRGSTVGPGKSFDKIVLRERPFRAVRCLEYAARICA